MCVITMIVSLNNCSVWFNIVSTIFIHVCISIYMLASSCYAPMHWEMWNSQETSSWSLNMLLCILINCNIGKIQTY